MSFSDFTFAQLNVRSLIRNFDVVRDLIVASQYQVFALTETWLSDGVSSGDLAVSNYILVRNDRCGRGGGTGVYISNNIMWSNLSVSTIIEQTWVKLQINGKIIAVGSVYRPPGSDYTEFLDILEDTVTDLLVVCDEIVLMGDFNIDLLNKRDASVVRFLSLIESYGLKQVIDSPTRITNSSSTLIDHVIISFEGQHDAGVVDVGPPFDHHLVYCTIQMKHDSIYPIIKVVRDYGVLDVDLLLRDLEAIDWFPLIRVSGIDYKLEYFSNIIFQLFDKHVPEKRVRITGPYTPWLTPTLREMMLLRKLALKKYKRTKSIADHEYYKQLRNIVNTAVQKEKKAYFNFKFIGADSKRCWNKLKSLLGSQKNCVPIPQSLSNPDEINDHFVDSIDCMSPPQELLSYYCNNRKQRTAAFSFKLVTEGDVLAALASITSSSVGSDLIPIAFIKMCCPHVLHIITHIVNTCLLEGVFPRAWKQAWVVPLAKVAHPTSFGDLRPISILPAVSKVVEKVVASQIRVFLSDNSILPEKQSGFRTGYSCETALMDLADDALAAIDRRELTALTLLDYSKAFDTVDHDLLLAILHYVGFDNAALNFFKHYLSGRSQCVKIGDNISKSRLLKRGVAQGSVCGPLLYVIYTSNFSNYIKNCSSHFYADDSQLYLSFSLGELQRAVAQMNSDLTALVDASRDHCLKINPSKSAVMLMGSRFALDAVGQFRVTITGVELPVVESAKSLGVILDSRLTFQQHVSKKVQVAFASLKKLYAIKEYLNLNSRKRLCEAFVLSQFNYCSGVYGPCLDVATASRVQRVQNACLRFMYGIPKFSRISHRLKDACWLSMTNRTRMRLAILSYKIMTSGLPKYLYNKITYRTDVHHLNLRHRGRLQIPCHRTSAFKKSFSYNVVSLWNALPVGAAGLGLGAFRRKIESSLLSGEL